MCDPPNYQVVPPCTLIVLRAPIKNYVLHIIGGGGDIKIICTMCGFYIFDTCK